jgi:hypothetical protein
MDIARLREGIAKTVFKNGVEFTVQTTSGRKAEDDKRWTCLGCNLVFGPGISHVVVWETAVGPQNRRHFHNGCWQKYQGRIF